MKQITVRHNSLSIFPRVPSCNWLFLTSAGQGSQEESCCVQVHGATPKPAAPSRLTHRRTSCCINGFLWVDKQDDSAASQSLAGQGRGRINRSKSAFWDTKCYSAKSQRVVRSVKFLKSTTFHRKPFLCSYSRFRRSFHITRHFVISYRHVRGLCVCRHYV